MSGSIPRLQKNTLFVLMALLSGAANAQPSPGQVGDTLKKAPELKLPEAVPSVLPQQREQPAEGAAGKKIVVRSFVFSGNTVYGSAQLASLIGSYTNRPISLLEIYDAADAIADFYVKHGYTLASVNVPAQKVSSGTIALEVSEGRINQILVEGTSSYQQDHVRDYLGAVKTGSIYRGDALDEGLRQLNHLPGLNAKAIIKPGEVYGTSDVVIKASEDPISGSLAVDNYGRRDIGSTRFSAFVQLNNPMRVEDRLQFLVLRSNQGLLNYYYAAYSLPVNTDGTRLDLSFGHAKFGVEDAPVDGVNNSGKVMLEHYLFDNRRDSATINAGLSRTRTNADFSGLTLNATSITLFEVGGTYNHNYDSQAVTQVTTSIATNFNKQDEAALKAAATSGQTLSGNQRFRWELDVQHLQPIHNRIAVLARVNTVFSPDALVDPQKFSLGGPQSVRGYPASEVRGDRGYLGSLTLLRPFSAGQVNMVGRVFIDSGKVYNIDPAFPDASLTSVGLGWDGQYNRISAKLDWSFPRGNHLSSDHRDDSRLFGSLTVAF
jgi:hemolysin activation/secretion protein